MAANTRERKWALRLTVIDGQFRSNAGQRKMVATLVEKVDDLQAIQREFLAKQGEAMSTIINHKSTAINSEHIVAAAATAAREAVQSAVGEFLATHRPDVSIVLF